MDQAEQPQYRWQGSASMGLGWGLFVGRAGDNHPHAHHAIQVMVSRTAQRLWSEVEGWQHWRGALIRPDVPHQLAGGSAPMTLLYVEPDSASGQALLGVMPQAITPLAPDDCDFLCAALGDQPTLAPVQLLTERLAGGTPALAGTSDELILRVLGSLPDPLPPRLNGQDLARLAYLSLSRFQHRFRAHTGMALRPYLRWRRLITGMAAVTRGAKLTDAALQAGFADAAHFTRTVRRHFGISPTSLSGLARS